MNKIVLEHYPVSNLPPDVRQAIGDVASVTLTIEGDSAPAREPLSAEEFVAQLRAEKRGKRPEDGISPEEAVARIRSLRDEWED